MAAERAVVGSEEDLVEKEGFTPEEVNDTYKTLIALGRAIISPPTDPNMTVTKMMHLGKSREEIRHEVAALAAQADKPLPRVDFEELEKLSELKQQEYMQELADKRGSIVIAKWVDKAVNADMSKAKAVELTPKMSQLALRGIHLEFDKAAEEHREADQKVLAGTARWIIEHTAEITDKDGQIAA